MKSVLALCVYVFVWVILSDGRRKHIEPSFFRSVPMPVSDLGLLTDFFNPSSGGVLWKVFISAGHVYASPCACFKGERSSCQMSKNLFQSGVKSMRCLFVLHLYSSCSAGLLMTEVLDLYINMGKLVK